MRTESEDAAYHDGRVAGWQAAEEHFENTLEAAQQTCDQRAADLAAAQERLAEMRQHIEVALRFLGPNNPRTVNWLKRAVDELNEALSATPAGQVLYRGKHSVYVDSDGRASTCLVPIRLSEDAHVDQGELLTVTVYKATPAEQEGD